MKITEGKLRQIIREELGRLGEMDDEAVTVEVTREILADPVFMTELEGYMAELATPPESRAELEVFILDMLEGDPWMGMVAGVGADPAMVAKNLSWDVARQMGMPQ